MCTIYKFINIPIYLRELSHKKLFYIIMETVEYSQIERFFRFFSFFVFLPRDASAERGYEIAFVCLSVTFRYQQHIGWNCSKIISWPNSLRPLLWLTPNTGDLVHPKIRVE